MSARWPERLWIVRHGQSAGNVARDTADSRGLDRIEVSSRDVDVPLSDLGVEQALALGRWFAAMPEAERPGVTFASPYARAVRTAQLIREAGGFAGDEAICIDERLREKEFGVLDGLTGAGVRNLMPDQAEFRRLLGKFYHRPPGGESWCDVILRLRSVLDTIALHHAERRVLVVAHQVVVLCLRYVVEKMDEEGILAIDRAGDVPNCAVTEYALDRAAGRDGGLTLTRFNFTAPVDASGTRATTEADRPKGARG